MRKYFLCLVVMIAGCSPNQTEQDAYLQSVFDRQTVAVVYDEVCDGGKAIHEKQPNLFASLSYIETRWAEEILKSNPDWSQEKISNVMKARRIVVGDRMKEALSEKGACSSVVGEDGKKLLAFLTTTQPKDFSAMIEENLSSVKK